MNNGPECLPCCLRRVLHTASLVTSDDWLHRKILAEAMQGLARTDEDAPPAEVVHRVVRAAARTLGDPDPHGAEKRRWLEETTAHEDVVRGVVDESDDPFRTALWLSVASNLLDSEFRGEVQPGFSLRELLERAQETAGWKAADGLPQDGVEDLRDAVARAGRILFIHDTAGELFFDRLLIERFVRPREDVVSVVREAPILAHATRRDAERAGLDRVAGEILDPGIDCLGLPLTACSPGFRARYAGADLVVAKGQAAYETLEGDNARIDGEQKEVFFLLRVKCGHVARALGAKVGDCIVDAP